jgi:integrase
MAQLSGIEVRHGKGCGSRASGRCNCRPTYQASVWSAREAKRIRKTFPTLAAARAWRSEAQTAVRRGTLRAPSAMTLREAADAWLTGARDGSIRNRSGDRYKPSAVRGYEASLRLRLLPALGGARLSELRRADVQDLVDTMMAREMDASTIRNTLMPLRAICRRAVARGDIAINPTSSIELPAVRGRRERIVAPPDAAALIAALPARDRALWATALYAGLRRGELQALRWTDVDLATGVIRVERSWDRLEGVIEPKSRAGRRSVPIAAVLRDHLVAHEQQTATHELVFATSNGNAFDPATIADRSRRAWSRAELDAITLHDARHTFASLMIAAGVNAKALSAYMGHASVTITYDRYGHLMPGSESEAAARLDAYLERADARVRPAQRET